MTGDGAERVERRVRQLEEQLSRTRASGVPATGEIDYGAETSRMLSKQLYDSLRRDEREKGRMVTTAAVGPVVVRVIVGIMFGLFLGALPHLAGAV